MLVVSTVVACLLFVVSASPEEEKLLQSLTQDYDPNTRPVAHSNDSLTVNLTFSLVNLGAVDVDRNEITVDGWLQLQWTDVKLRWSVSQNHGISSLHIPVERLWKPDIKVYNGPDTTVDQTLAIAHSDGTVLWVPPIKTTVHCHLKAVLYPFDKQNCSIIFGSWTYDVSMIDLQIGARSSNDFFKNKEWELVSLEHKRFEKKYECCANAYPNIQSQFTIRRYGCKNLFNQALPVATTAAAGLLTMIIPAARAEMRLLIVTLLLGTAVNVADFTDAPETFNAMSLCNTLMILNLVAIFLCNCLHLTISKGSFDTILLEKLAGLVSSSGKSENLISDAEERYHRALDKIFTVPLTFLFIITIITLSSIPFF